jgi:hypothetical protein
MNFVWCAGKFLKTQLNARERCPLRVQDSGNNYLAPRSSATFDIGPLFSYVLRQRW